MPDNHLCPATGFLQRGVSLVEVMVATVVLSLGLLGLAGLQASGLRVGQSSVHRSQAAQLAYDVIERMRANSARAGDYVIELADAPPEGESIAARDLRDWRVGLRLLPSGTGSIAIDGAEVTVTVQWDDSRGAGTLRGTAGDEAAREALRASQFVVTARLTN